MVDETREYYGFIACMGTVVDVAQHVCAAQGWGPPSDNGAAVRLLGERGVLAPDQAERLGKAVGFRNVLVHEYVDDALVKSRLGDLSDLAGFSEDVVRWLELVQR